MLCLDLEVLAVLDVCEGGDAVDAEAEHLHVPQPRDDRDVGELGAPAVELLDLVHVTDPGPRHDHILIEFHHPDPDLHSQTHRTQLRVNFCNVWVKLKNYFCNETRHSFAVNWNI